MSTRLRGRRSASAPPNGPRMALGMNAAAATNPVHPARCVVVVTRMPTPTVSIHVPMFDANAPAHSSANDRCRRGASERGSATQVTVTGTDTVQAVPREPRPGGRIVEVANFPSRFQADAAVALLAANGINAMAKYGDAEGWAPHLGLLDGYRVMVFDEDLD